jgi:hypothetical protein
VTASICSVGALGIKNTMSLICCKKHSHSCPPGRCT